MAKSFDVGDLVLAIVGCEETIDYEVTLNNGVIFGKDDRVRTYKGIIVEIFIRGDEEFAIIEQKDGLRVQLNMKYLKIAEGEKFSPKYHWLCIGTHITAKINYIDGKVDQFEGTIRNIIPYQDNHSFGNGAMVVTFEGKRKLCSIGYLYPIEFNPKK